MSGKVRGRQIVIILAWLAEVLLHFWPIT